MARRYINSTTIFLFLLLFINSISTLNKNTLEKKQLDKKILYEKKLSIMKTTEEGFVGPSSGIINEKEFSKYYPSSLTKKNLKKDDLFEAYTKIVSHKAMLADKRTLAYKALFDQNTDIFKNKIILDIGSGTGALSMWAAMAGAKHVYSIEVTDTADFLQENINENNLSDKITVIKEMAEDLILPVDKVDIIVQDLMGDFVINDSTFNVVFFARDKWLKPDGLIFPNRYNIIMAAAKHTKENSVDFWDDVYGLKMSSVKKADFTHAKLKNFDVSPDIISNKQKIYEIDFYTATVDDLAFSSGYKLIFNQKAKIGSIVMWHNYYFERVPNQIVHTTGPNGVEKYATLFYMSNYVQVDKNDVLKGSIAGVKLIKNPRKINMKISYHIENKSGNYHWNQLYDFLEVIEVK